VGRNANVLSELQNFVECIFKENIISECPYGYAMHVRMWAKVKHGKNKWDFCNCNNFLIIFQHTLYNFLANESMS
jgi:hypothetical protein